MSKPNPTLVMPWGKYRDKTIEQIPADYLEWLDEHCRNENIASAAMHELKYRQKHGVKIA